MTIAYIIGAACVGFLSGYVACSVRHVGTVTRLAMRAGDIADKMRSGLGQ